MPIVNTTNDPSFTTENMSTNHDTIVRAYNALKGQGLQLDMTRGKPCPEQLSLSDEILSIRQTRAENGTDCRNYGGLEGLPEMRELFANYLGVTATEVVIGGNSSLALMHDIIQLLVTSKLWTPPSGRSWRNGPEFICPTPGYDRHFAICEKFGIKMNPVRMDNDGPDMRAVSKLIKKPSVVGMWCVPKYSNPTGITYSDNVVSRLASMETANPNFRIFWDNAYAVHDLTDSPRKLLNIQEECRRNGDADRVYIFGSTSKITFAGSGVSAVAMSEANKQRYLQALACQTIGPDKLNQLRHVLFLQNMARMRKHMNRHAQILKPKFEMVLKVLEDQLGGKCLARWTNPEGGYFISLDVKPGCAKRVVQLAKEAGVTFTPAGATFPYGIDPRDSNIRIAPSFPSVAEIQVAIQVLCLCIQIAAAELKK